MGALYDFTCSACGYHAKVSGGRDAGMEVATATIVCRDCQKLFDVVLPGKAWTADRAESAPIQMSDLRCPRRKGHAIALWIANDPCPRCGECLPQGDPVVLWD